MKLEMTDMQARALANVLKDVAQIGPELTISQDEPHGLIDVRGYTGGLVGIVAPASNWGTNPRELDRA